METAIQSPIVGTQTTFVVNPINDIQASLDNFGWYYEWIKTQKLEFNLESTDGSQAVELIKCKPGKFDVILREIDARGYMPAPSPYLLGLGVQYPQVIKEYGLIVSLDENNLLPREDNRLCFTGLSWRNLNVLYLVETRTNFINGWWFAVLKKNAIQPVVLDKPVQLFENALSNVFSMNKVTLTRSQKLAYLKIKSGQNLFLTGVAGTGKTFLLNLIEKLTGKRVFLTASTGGASLHLENGRTVSSFLGLGRYDEETASFKCHHRLDNSILVIDEISMIGVAQWDYIMRSIKKNSTDFRTVQIIICGDLWQMPPMHWDQPLFNVYSEKEICDTNEIIDIMGYKIPYLRPIEPTVPELDFQILELKEIVRQSDAEFISKLMDIRFYGLNDHLPWLYKNSGNPEKLGITLVSSREIMNEMNETIEKGRIESRYELLDIEDDDRPYDRLELWKDMKVIITSNNLRKGYVNGDTGKIMGFDKKNDDVLIQLDRNNQIVSVQEVRREYYRNVYSLDNEQKEIIVQEKDYYFYMPLLSAYFLSVRRSQGSTLEYGTIHESVLKAVVCRQYTALSRFKSIKNVHIEKRKKKTITKSQPVIFRKNR